MIRNESTQEVFSNVERVCISMRSQARGLMFRRKQNLVMEFATSRKIALHNFFVFYPLEVVIVDEDMKVVEVKKNFRPFTVWNSAVKGKYVIELGLQESWGKVAVEDKLGF